ncbi:MAG: molybdate ABC transporter permease subunit [Candidatus Methylacidiphilales bacterium]|nr:molybdate ABC transporter permease subunit [Candidatus Methylacidiphilales bacterium]
MTPNEWQTISFTVRMALIAMVLVMPPCLVVAWALARFRWPGKSFVETLVALPLVMPPVAVGLILLKIFSRRNPLGAYLESIGLGVIFTWRAVVLALAVMAMPMVIRTARVAFESVDPRLEQIARTLGAGEWRVFWRVTFPLALPGLAAAALLGFARALGEFGATMLVAGNIPGKTATISLGIWSAIQEGDGGDAAALRLLVASVLLAFIATWASEHFLAYSRRR